MGRFRTPIHGCRGIHRYRHHRQRLIHLHRLGRYLDRHRRRYWPVEVGRTVLNQVQHSSRHRRFHYRHRIHRHRYPDLLGRFQWLLHLHPTCRRYHRPNLQRDRTVDWCLDNHQAVCPACRHRLNLRALQARTSRESTCLAWLCLPTWWTSCCLLFGLAFQWWFPLQSPKPNRQASQVRLPKLHQELGSQVAVEWLLNCWPKQTDQVDRFQTDWSQDRQYIAARHRLDRHRFHRHRCQGQAGQSPCLQFRCRFQCRFRSSQKHHHRHRPSLRRVLHLRDNHLEGRLVVRLGLYLREFPDWNQR